MRKKQIAIITLFTIVITYLGSYFQWGEFYEGYGLSSANLYFSIIFLLVWLNFSFYWGIAQEEQFKKFIIVYWGIGIISSIFIWFFKNKLFIQSMLFPFYVWYGGPLYGFRHMLFLINKFNQVDISTLILITSPLGLIFSFIGYWLGERAAKTR